MNSLERIAFDVNHLKKCNQKSASWTIGRSIKVCIRMNHTNCTIGSTLRLQKGFKQINSLRLDQR